jgi:hypothetical protein
MPWYRVFLEKQLFTEMVTASEQIPLHSLYIAFPYSKHNSHHWVVPWCQMNAGNTSNIRNSTMTHTSGQTHISKYSYLSFPSCEYRVSCVLYRGIFQLAGYRLLETKHQTKVFGTVELFSRRIANLQHRAKDCCSCWCNSDASLSKEKYRTDLI